MAKLQSAERRAFGIPENGPPADPLEALSDQELEAEMQRLDREIAALRSPGGRLLLWHAPAMKGPAGDSEHGPPGAHEALLAH